MHVCTCVPSTGNVLVVEIGITLLNLVGYI